MKKILMELLGTLFPVVIGVLAGVGLFSVIEAVVKLGGVAV